MKRFLCIIGFHDWHYAGFIYRLKKPAVLMKCPRCNKFKPSCKPWAYWLPMLKEKS